MDLLVVFPLLFLLALFTEDGRNLFISFLCFCFILVCLFLICYIVFVRITNA
jgi:CHASE2 domain-containing sensor protein